MFPPQQALQPNFRYEPGPVAAKKIEPAPLDKILKETMDAFTNIKYDVAQLSNHANSALGTFRTAETLLGNPTRRSFFGESNKLNVAGLHFCAFQNHEIWTTSNRFLDC